MKKILALVVLLPVFALAQGVAPQPASKNYVDGKVAALTLTSVAWTDQTTSASTFYPSFFSAASGTGNPAVSSMKLTYVPSTGLLSATTFAGMGGFTLLSANVGIVSAPGGSPL